MYFAPQTTPTQISDRIIAFGRKLTGGTREPFYVSVKPVGQPLRCYQNCAHFVRENPEAKIVYGWIFWEAGWILEAEHHAIIQMPNGDYLDVTRQLDGESKVLFQPHDLPPEFSISEKDGRVLMDGLVYRNVIHPLSSTERRRMTTLDLTAECGYRTSEEALVEMGALKLVSGFGAWGPSKAEPLYRGKPVGRKERCPCGSGKKYKRCCMR